MRVVLAVFFFSLTAFVAGFYFRNLLPAPSLPTFIPQILEKPLEKYAIDSLNPEIIPEGEIEIGEVLNETEDFDSSLFTFTFSPTLDNNLKKTTGMLNVPKNPGKYPVILMLRGYVDQKLYITGTGTKNSSAFFAQNGFITVAPDFLGYGQSDTEAENIFEARFQTYITAVSLLKSVNQIAQWNGKNIFIWGHSNGGQIALTILEITGFNYPTVLWAPVTKPFPYSVLYYTDESQDKGKFIRSELAKFETDYDVDKYSLSNYLERINTPIQLHQGTADEAVPVAWSDSFIKTMENLDKAIDYKKHGGADHNLQPSWDNAIQQSLAFYEKYLNLP